MLEEGLSLAVQVRNAVSMIITPEIVMLTQDIKNFSILP